LNKLVLAIWLLLFSSLFSIAQTNLGAITTQSINGIITPVMQAGSSSDNGPVINSAISSLAGNAGKVIIPPGTWSFSTRINLPRSVILEGSGPQATVLRYTGTDVAIYHGDSVGNYAPQHGGIRDIGIVTSSIATGTTGIFSGGDPTGRISPSSDFCQSVFYENVLISGFDVAFKHGNNSFWITFINPTITQNNIGATAASGIFDSGEAINWIGGRLDNNSLGAFVNDGMENNLFGTAIDFNGNSGASPQVTNSNITATNTHWEVGTGPMVTGGTIRMHGGSVLVDNPNPALPWLYQANQQQNNVSLDGTEIYSNASITNLVSWSNGNDPSSQLILTHLTGNHNLAIASLVNTIPANQEVSLNSYFGGASNSAVGITAIKNVGPCTFTIKNGLITAISGC